MSTDVWAVDHQEVTVTFKLYCSLLPPCYTGVPAEEQCCDSSEDIHSYITASSCLRWDAADVNKVVCNTDQGSNITAAPVLYQGNDCQDHASNTMLKRALDPAHLRGLTLCSSLWIQFTFLCKCFRFQVLTWKYKAQLPHISSRTLYTKDI